MEISHLHNLEHGHEATGEIDEPFLLIKLRHTLTAARRFTNRLDTLLESGRYYRYNIDLTLIVLHYFHNACK